MLVIPDGMGAYFRYDNTIWNSGDLLVRHMLHDVLLDPRTGLALYDIAGNGETGTLTALLADFDARAKAAIGIGPISTVSCAVAGFSSKSGNFCAGDPGCPMIDEFTGEMDIMMFLRSLWQEFQRDGSLKMSIEDVQPGMLAQLYAFVQWGQEHRIFQNFLGGGGAVADVSVENDHLLRQNFRFPTIELRDDSCLWLSPNRPAALADIDAAQSPIRTSEPFLQICQVDKFLLVASPANMAELIERATAVVAGTTPLQPLLEGTCNTNTFAALWSASLPFGAAAPQFQACIDVDKINTRWTNRLYCYMGVNPAELNDALDSESGSDPCGADSVKGPARIARSLLYMLGRQPDMMRLGFASTMDNPALYSLTFQFFNPASAGTAVAERAIIQTPALAFDVSSGISDAPAGYYDLMFRFMSGQSRAMYQAIDPAKVQKMMVMNMNGTDVQLPALAGQIVERLNDFLLQFQQDQATP